MRPFPTVCLGLLVIILEVFFGSRAFYPDFFLREPDPIEAILAKKRPVTDKLSPDELAFLVSAPEIAIGVDPNFYPLETFDERGRYTGLASDYLRLIEKMTGLKFAPKRTPDWATAENLAREGEISLLPAAASTERREEFLLFTSPYATLPGVVMTRRDQSGEKISADNLAGKKIAVVKGYSWEDFLRERQPEAIVVEAPSTLDALKLVADGEADAVLDYEFNLLEKIQLAGALQLAPAGRVDANYGHAMAVRKDQRELFNIVSVALAEITPDEKASLAQKWLAGDREDFGEKRWQWLFFFFTQAILLCLGLSALFSARVREAVRARVARLCEPDPRA